VTITLCFFIALPPPILRRSFSDDSLSLCSTNRTLAALRSSCRSRFAAIMLRGAVVLSCLTCVGMRLAVETFLELLGSISTTIADGDDVEGLVGRGGGAGGMTNHGARRMVNEPDKDRSEASKSEGAESWQSTISVPTKRNSM